MNYRGYQVNETNTKKLQLWIEGALYEVESTDKATQLIDDFLDKNLIPFYSYVDEIRKFKEGIE